MKMGLLAIGVAALIIGLAGNDAKARGGVRARNVDLMSSTPPAVRRVIRRPESPSG
jgi:hypothetical protein